MWIPPTFHQVPIPILSTQHYMVPCLKPSFNTSFPNSKKTRQPRCSGIAHGGDGENDSVGNLKNSETRAEHMKKIS